MTKIDVNDIVGKKFGRLTVVEYSHNTKTYGEEGTIKAVTHFYTCQCECGIKCIVRRGNLTSGHTVSCGCYHREQQVNTNTSHGLSYSRIFRIYAGMKQRCYNLKQAKYNQYGGRGIKICDEWLADFMNFYTWSMSNGYNDTLSIDRIDVNGNYEPSNCRWVNMKIQQQNRTNNHLLTFNNEIHSITEWAEILKINRSTIKERLKKGWSVEQTLTTPVRSHNLQ